MSKIKDLRSSDERLTNLPELAEAVLADAKRYRWLRNRDNAIASAYVGMYIEPEQLDALIDAAILAGSLPSED
jgi:hypothetical protein